MIGDDAQTGSNSVLVAPLEIGAGATIGAGSDHQQGRTGRQAHGRPRQAGHARRLEAADEEAALRPFSESSGTVRAVC